MFRQAKKVASIKLKSKFVFNFLKLNVILAVIAIIASIAVPRFLNFMDKTSEKLLDAAIAELNGREELSFVDIKKSQERWVNDQIVFSQVNTEMGSGFHWAPKANINGGTLHFKDQIVKLDRIGSTSASADKWIKSK